MEVSSYEELLDFAEKFIINIDDISYKRTKFAKPCNNEESRNIDILITHTGFSSKFTTHKFVGSFEDSYFSLSKNGIVKIPFYKAVFAT